MKSDAQCAQPVRPMCSSGAECERWVCCAVLIAVRAHRGQYSTDTAHAIAVELGPTCGVELSVCSVRGPFRLTERELNCSAERGRCIRVYVMSCCAELRGCATRRDASLFATSRLSDPKSSARTFAFSVHWPALVCRVCARAPRRNSAEGV